MSHDILFFWVTVSLLLGLTITMLVFPLIRKWKPQSKIYCRHDLAVYREQLLEIERDFQNGLFSAEYTESRRTEIQRRMLQAADSAVVNVMPMNMSKKCTQQKSRVLQALTVSLVIAAGAVGLYLDRGAPGLPDRPAAAERMVEKNAERLADALAQYMEENPEKVEGWILLARFQRQLGVYAAAARSFHMAIERGIEDSDTLASYGEMLVADMGGQVTSEACTAFCRAHHHHPSHPSHNSHKTDDPRAAFYIGLAAFQEGKQRCAIAIWRGLEMYAPPGAPWLDMLRTHIVTAAAQAKMTEIIPQPVWDAPLCGQCATENFSSKRFNE